MDEKVLPFFQYLNFDYNQLTFFIPYNQKGLINLTKDVEIVIEDTKDSCEAVESMPKIPCFNNINEMLKRTLEIVEAAKIKDKKT